MHGGPPIALLDQLLKRQHLIQLRGGQGLLRGVGVGVPERRCVKLVTPPPSAPRAHRLPVARSDGLLEVHAPLALGCDPATRGVLRLVVGTVESAVHRDERGVGAAVRFCDRPRVLSCVSLVICSLRRDEAWDDVSIDDRPSSDDQSEELALDEESFAELLSVLLSPPAPSSRPSSAVAVTVPPTAQRRSSDVAPRPRRSIDAWPNVINSLCHCPTHLSLGITALASADEAGVEVEHCSPYHSEGQKRTDEDRRPVDNCYIV